jgi:hypothetical protein
VDNGLAAGQRTGKQVPAAMNTRVTTKESEWAFSLPSVLYQRIASN